MQRKLTHLRRSDDEAVKEQGLLLDLDEIARRGSMSAEEGLAAKWYGIHAARQPGNFMARVLVPGGVLSSAQARAVADAAEHHAQGRIALTTRQSLQLHWLKLYALPLLLRDLAGAGLRTFHGSGDVTRAVATCPRASVCPHRRLDVLPFARQAATLLGDRRDLDNLPRKLKLSFSGCGADCAQPAINCVGLTAIQRRGPSGCEERGFRVLVGGGLGRSPMLGEELYSFVPPAEALRLCVAIALFFRDHGDRYDRFRARLKLVVRELGLERCRELIAARFASEGGDPDRLEVAPLAESGAPWPARPLAHPEPRGSDGLALQSVRVPTGELRFRQLRALAELSELYGDKHLRITGRQNLELHGVRPGDWPRLARSIEELGLEPAGHGGLLDVAVCVGASYCPLAITRTRELHDRLRGLLQAARYTPIRHSVLINIAGCPNACAPYSVADLGLRGMRIREEQGSVEGYQLWIGGDHRTLGRPIADLKLADCEAAVSSLLDLFLRLRSGDETLADNVRRLGVEPYRSALASLGAAYRRAPAPRELSAPAAAARRTMEREVPCQPACPAGTDVPEFIRRITLGDLDAAYRINQEANVFPGVLGRVCTRPCESACRHRTTSTMGPVAVCHLKRSAADGKSTPARPLPPWFDPSGRRVAVVGGGPAGLAAARELRRYGHEVTLFEREHALGGMLRFGIPAFRLPRSVVDEEVAAIVESGIDVRLGARLDERSVSALADDFDAVLLAVGASRPRRPQLPGLPPELCHGGLEFVMQHNRGSAAAVIQPDVLVVGGGFTAVDCARLARRALGGEGRVRIVYRRTEGQMSASPDELWQLRLEGIEVETLLSPVSAHLEGGRLAGVTFIRNVLGEDSGPGKPPFSSVQGSELELPCGTLVFAVGQSPAAELLPEGAARVDRHRTTDPRLFLAGDFASGSLDVIHAVADGKAAADAIDERLTGRARRPTRVAVEPCGESGRLRDHDLLGRQPMPLLPVGERQGDAEVERGLDPAATRLDAWRCYQCNQKLEIDQDRCIHCNWCLRSAPRDCIRQLTRLFLDGDGLPTGFVETTIPREATYVWIDSDRCIRCGSCLRACPAGAISLRRGCLVRSPREETEA